MVLHAVGHRWDDQLRFSSMAVYVEGQGWRFTILYGLACGLEAAVVAFNRFPLLGCGRCKTMHLAYGCGLLR